MVTMARMYLCVCDTACEHANSDLYCMMAAFDVWIGLSEYKNSESQG